MLVMIKYIIFHSYVFNMVNKAWKGINWNQPREWERKRERKIERGKENHRREKNKNELLMMMKKGGWGEEVKWRVGGKWMWGGWRRSRPAERNFHVIIMIASGFVHWIVSLFKEYDDEQRERGKKKGKMESKGGKWLRETCTLRFLQSVGALEIS